MSRTQLGHRVMSMPDLGPRLARKQSRQQTSSEARAWFRNLVGQMIEALSASVSLSIIQGLKYLSYGVSVTADVEQTPHAL